MNLTAGTDSLVGTAGNDLFIAGDLATGTTWNVGDAVNGGAGSDTLNVISGAAVSVPTGASLTSVETVSITSGATGSNVNGASWTGVEKLNVTAPAAVTVTGAATTAVSVTNAALAAAAVTVNGGSTVAVNTTSTGTGSTVGIGATTAAAGAVTVNTTTSMADTVGATTATGTAVTVTGGTSVTVNNTLTASTSDDVGDVLTGGAVIVNGNASTTSVSVTQTAAAARVTTGTTKAAVANGAVTVTDVNATSATAAGTIASVKLENFGAGSIDSSALTTVDLVGTATSLNIGRGNLTAVPTANTLTLNVAGVTMTGALTDTEATADDGFTTLNIVSSGTASTIASLASTDLTTINMSGTSNVTFTANTTAALTTVAVTGTGGLTLGTAIGANATFTGGAGNDGVVLSNAFTKAITMGAGADTVTYNGAASVVAGLVGSVDAGEGVDTIKMTAAQADAADGTAAFNTAFKGFEVLDVATGATATTINLAGINAVNSVVTRGVAAANTLTIDGFTSGGSLTLDAAAGDAASSRVTANVTNAVLTPADTFNVTLKNSTAGVVSFGAVELAGIETVNITTQDAGLLTNVAATIDAAVLVAVDATKVVVAGNNGLNLTNTGNVKVTTFDASGVIGNDATDTAANLAVTFASANTTATANEDVQKVGFQAIYCMSHVQPCFQFLA
ncbi:beta strand repeat-containing protein [Noviherbaspirillum sp. Root189]|uniref:beta strand repeat-containing protein n=1 Tax=Noviherbaspirillum sp. Root189 TaxID=1736487 RepID=UPI0007162962|nr:hypothetical protein [Noviherbaspirillum sp. Root189]KRB85155.1 hypothetical protein ASE07_21575 [Noviherbaspirillum sp. Root189]